MFGPRRQQQETQQEKKKRFNAYVEQKMRTRRNHFVIETTFILSVVSTVYDLGLSFLPL